MKLDVVVGGGSTYLERWSTGSRGCGTMLPVAELVLVDPAAERAGRWAELARRIASSPVRRRHPGKVTWTADLDAAAGEEARRRRCCSSSASAGRRPGSEDETLAAGSRGFASRPETTAGGRARQGAADGAGRAGHRGAGAPGLPGAWLVDFTNPVGIVTRALLDEGTARSGCATSPSASSGKFARLLGLPPRTCTWSTWA